MVNKIYSELGIKPIINAIGSVTLLGGSTQPQQVIEAMQSAQDMYVPMDELEQKAGDYISKLFGAEACYITSGAGSALTLTTAAFMAGDNDDLIVKLPDTTGMKDEILIQSRQRYHYERCLTYAGAKLVEFGSQNLVTAADLENSITDKTVAVHYVANETFSDPQSLSLEETIKIAKSLCKGQTLAYGKIKELSLNSFHSSLESQLEMEARFFTESLKSKDFEIGVDSFTKKEKPEK